MTENLFIYDNEQLSISIIAKDQKTADRILKENVINPGAFTQEESMELDNLEFS